MSKLTEERDNATKMIALRKWVEDYSKKNKKDPSAKEILSFIQILNEKTAPATPEALINLIEKEEKVRIIARKIAFNEGIQESHFIINLKPNVNGTTIVSGGHPSVVDLGILPGDINFITVLRRMIRKAEKLYVPSALVLSSQKYEYDLAINKIKVWKGDPNYYPLLSKDRIQVRTYEMVQIIDMQTGETFTRTRQVEQGMFSHFTKNPLALEAHLDLSRRMYAEGKLSKEDFEYEDEPRK